jgi:prenyl protein peptidase
MLTNLDNYFAGHLVAPFLAHAFCNHMGFPDFTELFSQKQPYRSVLMIFFVVGLAAWAVLLLPMTQPSLYNNQLFWIQKTHNTPMNSSVHL